MIYTMSKNTIEFDLKPSDDLTNEEQEQLMHLSIATYPTFRDLYSKNKYYSTIKPQKVWLLRDGEKIVGTGKFLWKDIDVENRKIRMVAFGILIDEKYRRRGLGTILIERNVQEAKAIGADVLYGATHQQSVADMLMKEGFVRAPFKVTYEDIHIKNICEEVGAYILPLNHRVREILKNLQELFIGVGPV